MMRPKRCSEDTMTAARTNFSAPPELPPPSIEGNDANLYRATQRKDQPLAISPQSVERLNSRVSRPHLEPPPSKGP
jgi:hypothetical protein